MSDAPRSRWPKRAWPLALVAALAVAVGVAEWRGWPFLEGPLERQLSQRLQREVRFGEGFMLRVFGSLRLRADALRIGAPQGPRSDPALGGDLLNADDAWLELPYATVFRLLRGDREQPPRITSLRFGRVDAALKRLEDGRSNWSFAPPDASAPRRDEELPHVDELVVREGRLTLADAVIDTWIDAEVRTREGASGPRAPASGAQPGAPAAAQPAGLEVVGNGRRKGNPFRFRFASSGVLPLFSRVSREPVPVDIRIEARNSRFTFDGAAADLLELNGLDGSAVLTGPSLAAVGQALGLTLPTTPPFTLKGRLAKSGVVWSLKQADLDVGESRLGGAFSYDRGTSPPLLKGELNGARLVLADLLPAFGAPVHGAPNPKPPQGQVLPHREFDIPSLHAMNADVKVRVSRAELGALFRQPLSPLQVNVSLQGGVLKLGDVLARTSGGELTGGIALDARPEQPLWTADLRWADVDLDRLLRPRNPVAEKGEASGEKPTYMTGRLAGRLDAKGRGRSIARMAATLDGTLHAWVRNGTVSHLVIEAAGLDVAQALGVLVTGDDALPMNCAAVRAVAANGRLIPEVAIVDTPDTTVLVTGEVSLAEEKLDLTLAARPKDMSPVALRSPVHVRGTFADPQVQLDKESLALKILGAAALAAVNPLAALIPLFDPGDKEDAGGCGRTLEHLRQSRQGPEAERDAAERAERAQRAERPRGAR